MRTPKRLFVLADGGRARFVERSSSTGEYVTIRELDCRERLASVRRSLRQRPPARAFESMTENRSAVGREDQLREAKEDFMTEVAAEAAEVSTERGVSSIYVVAPSRLLAILRTAISRHVRVSGTLEKDLTKVPDHALGAWLATLPGLQAAD